MKKRGPWQGMLTIARLNWPFYVAVTAILLPAVMGMFLFAGWLPGLGCFLLVAGCCYFLFGSLGVSHAIYDRSDLYRWGWLERCLPAKPPTDFLFCHCGFDEASEALHTRLGEVRWTVLDHFEEKTMSEASIRRARRLFAPTKETLPAPFDQWPVKEHSVEIVFGLLAIHELRSEAERAAWFAEAKRCMTSDGRIILVEHVRDLANFLAFGPGFLHFHSTASWRRAWSQAGLHLHDEFRITPWVRVFTLVAV